MASDAQNLDMEKAQTMAEQVIGLLSGAMVSGMIYLGDRLGLYRALQGAGPLTSGELAQQTGLHERWAGCASGCRDRRRPGYSTTGGRDSLSCLRRRC